MSGNQLITGRGRLPGRNTSKSGIQAYLSICVEGNFINFSLFGLKWHPLITNQYSRNPVMQAGIVVELFVASSLGILAVI